VLLAIVDESLYPTIRPESLDLADIALTLKVLFEVHGISQSGRLHIAPNLVDADAHPIFIEILPRIKRISQ
jgi:hypothetical protein